MKTVSIRELHMHTGQWVRNVSEPIIITDQGRPVASLAPLPDAPRSLFRDRKLVPGFAELSELVSDSGMYLEEDRR
ncbi:MAG: type II toxin-antitoxin system Phd/YefM family antitoxin [Terrimicrobiaceae bacterium]|jgi:antitoxin (DNA-binding transcriptional repressor) of toxin-antitoxin stability system